MGLRFFCVVLSFLCLSGCEKKKEEGQGRPTVIITSPDSPPFEFKETAQGGDKIIGFDIDVAEKVAEHLGKSVKIIEGDFSSLIPSLQSGRADMAIAYLTPTEERKKNIDFSDPYYVTKISLLIPESSSISAQEDIEDKKLGVQLGSANEMIARKWKKEMPGLSLISLTKIGELVQELKNNRIQAILMEDIVAQKILKATPGLKIVSLDIPGGALAIGFPKGSALVAPTNKALKELKGEINLLEKKWLTP